MSFRSAACIDRCVGARSAHSDNYWDSPGDSLDDRVEQLSPFVRQKGISLARVSERSQTVHPLFEQVIDQPNLPFEIDAPVVVEWRHEDRVNPGECAVHESCSPEFRKCPKPRLLPEVGTMCGLPVTVTR